MKKFLTLLMALAMVLSLAACGGGDKPADDAGNAGDAAPADTGAQTEDTGDAGSSDDAAAHAFNTV